MEHHSSILFSEAFTGLDYICDSVNIIPVSSEEYDMEVLSPGLLFRERVVGFSASQFRSCVKEMNSLAKEFKVLLPGVERYFNKDMALFRIEEATESARFPSRRRKTWSNEMKYAFIYMQKALVKSFLDILTDELGLVLEYISENICRTRGYEDYHCEISIFGKNGERETYKVDIYHLGEVTGSILEEFSQEHLTDYAAD